MSGFALVYRGFNMFWSSPAGIFDVNSTSIQHIFLPFSTLFWRQNFNVESTSKLHNFDIESTSIFRRIFYLASKKRQKSVEKSTSKYRHWFNVKILTCPLGLNIKISKQTCKFILNVVSNIVVSIIVVVCLIALLSIRENKRGPKWCEQSNRIQTIHQIIQSQRDNTLQRRGKNKYGTLTNINYYQWL